MMRRLRYFVESIGGTLTFRVVDGVTGEPVGIYRPVPEPTSGRAEALRVAAELNQRYYRTCN